MNKAEAAPLHAVSSGRNTEAEALAALREGDHNRALSILMEDYGDALYRYCRRMVGEPLAEDVHQMSLVQAYESFTEFRGQSSLRTWLYGIARHRCLDALRKERRHETTSDAMPEMMASESGLYQRLAARQVLTRCLEKLKPKARDIVVLRYMEELSFPEMAVICQEDAATLQMRLTRILPVLRRCIEAKSR